MSRAKKQATLFDLGGQKGTENHGPKKEPFSGPDNTFSVGCPVCSTAMDSLSMENRIKHVEECLSMAAIQESRTIKRESVALKAEPCPVRDLQVSPEISVSEQETIEVIELDENESPDEKQEIVINARTKRRGSQKAPPQKRKRELGAPQKEKLRYVNSQPTVKRKKEATPKNEEERLELLPSSRKNEIPDLKVLKFPVKDSTIYRLSVDAFCYKPHDSMHQYFLSHFHSDHYGGITKKWCRERTIDSKIIYCSEITGRLLNIRYSVEPCHLFSMKNDTRYKIHSFEEKLENGGQISAEMSPGVYVTCIDANHCPGAVIFLFEGISMDGKSTFTLHCGDFRVNKNIMLHPLLQRFLVGAENRLENVYLDTTYMTPKYNFPKQEQVCESVATLIHEFANNDTLVKEVFGSSLQTRITDFLTGKKATSKKYLVLVGTYLIGKEKLAVAVSKRLGNSPIYVSNVHSRGDKDHIIRSYHDEYLDSVLTTDAVATSHHDVMIHLVPMKIAGNIQELQNYFNHNGYHSHFERCIGLRPTGWSFKNTDEEPEGTEETVEIDEAELSLQSTAALLKKRPKYTHLDVLAQKTNKANKKADTSTHRIYSIPYSEHSSFRELSYFVVFFNIGHVIPTVNTSNPYSASAMAEIIRRWETIREVMTGKGKNLPQFIQDAVSGLSLDDF
ncbi:hypothetical protein OXX79_011980 [Metschnikowia pulcherrima]